jgi:hypothetical protein
MHSNFPTDQSTGCEGQRLAPVPVAPLGMVESDRWLPRFAVRLLSIVLIRDALATAVCRNVALTYMARQTLLIGGVPLLALVASDFTGGAEAAP